jgi:hypothetical protein
MERILIATPCLNQKVDAYFVHSLCESIKLGIKKGFDIKCVFLANESILPMARNELLNLAYKENYDAMVFIDDDEMWDEKALIEILSSSKDVIAVPVVNKGDINIQYNVYFNNVVKKDSTDGYLIASHVGTGFLKLSKKVIKDLWISNVELEFRGKKLKNICEFTYTNGNFIGEDITLSNKIRELGYKIWIKPNHTVYHLGNKMYKGDFESTIKKL